MKRINILPNPARWPFFYGWVVLFWGTLGVLMGMPGQTIGVSVFTEPLIDALGITRNQLSFAYMMGTIGSSFLLPWAGRQYDLRGVRPVAITASVGLGLVLIMLSQVDRVLFANHFQAPSWLVVLLMMILFLFLRFFGQGVINMASRNMTLQWFESRRGFATGFSNLFVSLGFSFSPALLYILIQDHSWRGAWLILAMVAVFIFPIFIFLFYRDKPEDYGLKADGSWATKRTNKSIPAKVRNYTLSEVRKNYTFWVFALMLALQGLYITAFTFHVVSVFEVVGLSEKQAVSIFQPIAVIAVGITLGASALSDYISVKPLFVLKGLSACLAILGVISLGTYQAALPMIVIGHGLMTGLFSVLMSITWPRYFGRLHLGAISGQSLSLIVFGSALGPILFSQSFSKTGSYKIGGIICLIAYILLIIAVLFTKKPHDHQIR